MKSWKMYVKILVHNFQQLLFPAKTNLQMFRKIYWPVTLIEIELCGRMGFKIILFSFLFLKISYHWNYILTEGHPVILNHKHCSTEESNSFLCFAILFNCLSDIKIPFSHRLFSKKSWWNIREKLCENIHKPPINADLQTLLSMLFCMLQIL